MNEQRRKKTENFVCQKWNDYYYLSIDWARCVILICIKHKSDNINFKWEMYLLLLLSLELLLCYVAVEYISRLQTPSTRKKAPLDGNQYESKFPRWINEICLEGRVGRRWMEAREGEKLTRRTMNEHAC